LQRRTDERVAKVPRQRTPHLDGVRNVMCSLTREEYSRQHRRGVSIAVSVSFDDPGWDPMDVVEALPETMRVDLFETPGGPADLERRTFLTWAPEFELVLRQNVLETWRRSRCVRTRAVKHPLQELRRILQRQGATRLSEADGFRGGFVGFLSYEFKNHLEALPDTVLDDLETPELRLGFVRRVLSWDHRASRISLCVNLRAQSDDADADYADVLAALDAFYGEVVSLEVTHSLAHAGVTAAAELERPPRVAPQALRSNLSRQAYDDMLAAAKQHIFAGDIYQANLSHRFEAPFRGSGAPLYRHLRRINPSPFASYIRLPALGSTPSCEIVSCSPERLVRVQEGKVETRPIAGTRPRNVDSHADRQLERDLLDSDKERAEHVMIVDMARNDIGRVCKRGTVHVDRFMSVERYSHVRHLVSNVSGELSDDCDALDVLAATFPGASITGVPKVRCMQIIDELETVRRGIYTGSAGYIGLDGAIDLNILIRSFLLQEGRAWFHVGGGIVADSDAEHEYDETISKGRALYEALVAVSHSREEVGTAFPATSRHPNRSAQCEDNDSFS
jgi:anthranilate/para-aminobenzoate synthase component I